MNRDVVLDWLLEADNPPVRLLTLTRLLHRAESDPEVQRTRGSLMSYSVTQEILAQIDEIWNSGKRSFWSYKGRNWNTVYLGQFFADGRDSRIAKGVEPMLDRRWVGEKWNCMAAAMLRAFRQLGYGSHPTVVEETEALAQRLLDEGGITCPGMNTSLMSHCYMTLPKVLLCLTEVPMEERSATIQSAIAWIVDELVDHQVYIYLPGNRKAWDEVRPRSCKKSDYPEGATPESWRDKMMARFLEEHGMEELEPKRSWTRFGFPTNYNSDVLEAMYALATAGAPMSPKLEKPLQVIRDQRTDEGVWLLDKTFNGQMWADVEVKGEPSKWITLFALIVLKHFGENGA